MTKITKIDRATCTKLREHLNKKLSDIFNRLLDGIHPMLRQVPPKDPLDSTHAVFNPNCDNLIAHTYPAGPPPITVTSNFSAIRYLKIIS